MKKVSLFVVMLSSCLFLMTACSGGKASNVNISEVYPEKTVQIVIAYGPGGGSDILARALMKHIKLPHGRNMVAINVDGASGYIGAQHAYNAKNDGYTILAHNPMDVVSYTLNGTTDIAIWEEMPMVASMVDDFNVISTSPRTGWTTIEEVIEGVKQSSEKIKWGVTGAQNVNYADTLRVIRALGIEDYVTIVPYNGGAESKTALMGGHILLETNSSSDIKSAVESGDALPLLVIGDRRAAALPEVRSTEEYGLDIVTTKPRGYYIPKGTDPAVIEILQGALEEVTKNEEFIALIESLGLEVNFVKGEEMQAQISEWVETLKPIFKEFEEN